MASEKVFGLIAGGGRLPFIIAAGARKAGFKVICVGLRGSVDTKLANEVDIFYQVAIARPGSWIRKLNRHGVRETVMAGRVAKSRLFTPWRILQYLPDWRAFRIFYWRLLGKDKQDDSLLGAVADELAAAGIILENSTMYCKEHLASKGIMTQSQPGSATQNDIDFGWTIAKKLAELDIGQAIAVKEREVVAVEAIEGTEEMIKRAGKFCKSGRWTLIKVARPEQDWRFDVPCIGPETIRGLAENGGKCVLVEAENVIIIDKPETIKLADKLGICIAGH